MSWGQYLACVTITVGGVGGLMTGLALLLRGRRLLAAAQEAQAEAARAESSATQTLATAHGILTEAGRIEALLVCPRWAMNLQSGRVHALLHGEEPELTVEVECQAPDENCHDCGGRGWAGRDTKSQRVLPCKCVKRELHRRSLVARG